MSTRKQSTLLRLVGAFTVVMALVGSMFATAGSALAGGTLEWSGQGVTNGQLNSEICGIANGAEVDGPYLLWVFTGGGQDGSASATITITSNGQPVEVSAPMTQQGGGAFQYVSGYYDLASIGASVDYDGNPSNPQLTISHGCPPAAPKYWCSPGFWKTRQGTLAGTAYDPTPYLNDYVPGTQFTVAYALANPKDVGGSVFNAAADYLAARFGWTGTKADYPGGTDANGNPLPSDNCPIDADGNLVG